MFCIKRGEFGKSTWSLLLSFARSLGGNGCSNVSYKESLTWLMNPLLLNLSWIEHHWRGPDHGNSDLRHWQAGTSPNDRLAALMTDGEKNDLGHSLKSLASKVFSSAWWVFLSILHKRFIIDTGVWNLPIYHCSALKQIQLQYWMLLSIYFKNNFTMLKTAVNFD